jgi:purine-binding chemotaxis protein CheW
MNRPIDWKKISELKRQAPPPENPLGDMLSELLEVEAALPAVAETIPSGRTFDVPEPVYPVAPNLEIHAKVETDLSKPCAAPVSVVSTTSEAVNESQNAGETACPANTSSPLQVVVEQAFSLSPSLEIADLPQTLIETPESPPVANPEMDDLLAMLLESESTEVATFPEERTVDSIRTVPESPKAQELKAHFTRESCLVFSLGGSKFGIPIQQVTELDKLPRITPVPNVPDWVRGVTNLRGEILSVLDLRLLLGMERRESLERGRILVVRLGEDLTAALVVDEVNGIAKYAQERLTPAGAGEGEKVIPLLDGIYSSEDIALKILNMDKLMATPELRRLEAA